MVAKKLPPACRHCGEDDTSKLLKRKNGTLIRCCRKCTAAYMNGRLSQKPLACKCGESNIKNLAHMHGSPIRRCHECNRKSTAEARRRAKEKAAPVIDHITCRICCQSRDVERKWGRTAKTCPDCIQSEKDRLAARRERLAVAPTPKAKAKGLPTPSEAARMAKVRAAIKALPIGYDRSMLYDISRRVAEGAL